MVVPHSKVYVVARPFGLTVPFKVALTVVTAVAGSVTTVGAPVGADPLVVKVSLRPLTTEEPSATTR